MNEQGLPDLVTDYSTDEECGSKTPHVKFTDLTVEQHKEALEVAFDGKPIKGFENAVQAMIPAYERIGFKRGRSVMVNVLQYLVNDLKLVTRHNKMFYFGAAPRDTQLFENGE